MLVIGEKINSSLKEVEAAIVRRDAAFVEDLARRQQQGGADYLEVNSGLRLYPEEEAQDLEWLVPLVQGETGLPLCIDSAHSLVVEAALRRHRGTAIVNSITGDPDRWEEILPLVKEYGCGLIALPSDKQGIPPKASGRLKIVEKIVHRVSSYGIPLASLYIDPMVMPVSADTRHGMVFLETLQGVKQAFPEVKTVSGLSNVSFGLPRRSLINQAFLVLGLGAGLDAAILDPLDKRLMALGKAAGALLNQDPFCLKYITAYREGKLA